MSEPFPRAPLAYALYRNPSFAPYLGPYSESLFADDDANAIDKARARARVLLRSGCVPDDAMSLTALETGRRHVGAWSLASLAAKAWQPSQPAIKAST